MERPFVSLVFSYSISLSVIRSLMNSVSGNTADLLASVWERSALLSSGRERRNNNLQRILHHRHIHYHVLIHFQNKFKFYPYIQARSDIPYKLSAFKFLRHHSSVTRFALQ